MILRIDGKKVTRLNDMVGYQRLCAVHLMVDICLLVTFSIMMLQSWELAEPELRILASGSKCPASQAPPA